MLEGRGAMEIWVQSPNLLAIAVGPVNPLDAARKQRSPSSTA